MEEYEKAMNKFTDRQQISSAMDRCLKQYREIEDNGADVRKFIDDAEAKLAEVLRDNSPDNLDINLDDFHEFLDRIRGFGDLYIRSGEDIDSILPEELEAVDEESKEETPVEDPSVDLSTIFDELDDYVASNKDKVLRGSTDSLFTEASTANDSSKTAEKTSSDESSPMLTGATCFTVDSCKIFLC